MHSDQQVLPNVRRFVGMMNGSSIASDRGIHLLLPWQDRQPENSRLMLAVRYMTVDGRKLESRRDIFVTLPGQYSQRWTPRADDERAYPPQLPPASVARQPSGTE